MITLRRWVDQDQNQNQNQDGGAGVLVGRWRLGEDALLVVVVGVLIEVCLIVRLLWLLAWAAVIQGSGSGFGLGCAVWPWKSVLLLIVVVVVLLLLLVLLVGGGGCGLLVAARW